MKRFEVTTRDVETGRSVRARTIRARAPWDAVETAARRRYRLPASAVVVPLFERPGLTETQDGLSGALSVYLRSPSGALYPEPLHRSTFVAVVAL